MVEQLNDKGLATSMESEISLQTERVDDRHIRLNLIKLGSCLCLLTKNMAASTFQNLVHTYIFIILFK